MSRSPQDPRQLSWHVIVLTVVGAALSVVAPVRAAQRTDRHAVAIASSWTASTHMRRSARSLERELKGSGEDWKVVFMHHPLYSSGGRHGSDIQLRETLEPLLMPYNVSVVFAGHDHFYERVKPQKGIAHFVIGSGGKLAVGDLDDRSPLTAKGFDTDYAFLAAEVIDDQMYFNTISRAGQIVDSGIILRQQPVAP